MAALLILEQTLQEWMELKVNREKTRTVNLQEPGVGLNFLGYTFRYDRDWYGRDEYYLNLVPSEKTLQRVRNHLNRRSQRGYQKPKDVTWWDHLRLRHSVLYSTG